MESLHLAYGWLAPVTWPTSAPPPTQRMQSYSNKQKDMIEKRANLRNCICRHGPCWVSMGWVVPFLNCPLVWPRLLVLGSLFYSQNPLLHLGISMLFCICRQDDFANTLKICYEWVGDSGQILIHFLFRREGLTNKVFRVLGVGYGLINVLWLIAQISNWWEP